MGVGLYEFESHRPHKDDWLQDRSSFLLLLRWLIPKVFVYLQAKYNYYKLKPTKIIVMRRLSAILLLAAAFITSCGQSTKKETRLFDCDYVTTPGDSVLATEIINVLKNEAAVKEVSTPELMVIAGRSLLGKEYVAGTLDGGEKEILTLYLNNTDCILFVEACTNLARAAVNPKFPENNFLSYAADVLQTRYRDGKTEHYSDRIHYTTEWIRQAQANGILEDKTLEFGGEVYDHPINFMSNNIAYYKQIQNAATNEEAAADLARIKEIENTLNQTPQYYIKDVNIVKAEPFIQTGDIIGYMAATEGLDIAHVAMAYVTDPDGNVVYGPHDSNAKVGFMHASMAEMQVVIDHQSISDYAKGRKSITGICVARVK